MSKENVARLFIDAVSLADKLGAILRDNQLTIAVAESATGGLIMHVLTEIPGCSQYFLGGIVAYANKVKQNLLNVPLESLDRFGAVSEKSVATLANNIRQIMDADIGLATSGIAGPTGERPNKPLGLVFIAIAMSGKSPIISKLQFTGNRTENKLHFASATLKRLLKEVQEKT